MANERRFEWNEDVTDKAAWTIDSSDVLPQVEAALLNIHEELELSPPSD